MPRPRISLRREMPVSRPTTRAPPPTARTYQRDCILGQGKRSHHQAQGPARGFAARARQFIVELGILELRQIQRQCFFQNHDIDALAQLRAKQRLRQRNSTLRHRGGGDQQCLQRHVPYDIGQRRHAGAPMQIRGVNDGIHDLRADIGDAGGQHACDECEQGESDAQRLVGAPHQLEGSAAIGEHPGKVQSPTAVAIVRTANGLSADGGSPRL
jgi:hypothetical protein